MASLGPNSPSTIISDSSSGGSTDWSSQSNASVNDCVEALCTMAVSTQSYYLKATNFGFNVSSDATINGILVEIKWWDSQSSNKVQDWKVRIIKGGTISTTEMASGQIANGILTCSTSDPYDSYGSSSSLWGETWTPADINVTNFGFAFACQNLDTGLSRSARIDHIRTTIYYTLPTTGNFFQLF